MNRKLKTLLQQLNFHLGRNPRLIKNDNWQEFIPSKYKSIVTISADFELAWAWRYTKSSANPLDKTLKKAELERENLPKILHLSERYNIPITWLTVGHLFLESCQMENGIAHSELIRIPKFENNFWHFQGEDWFEYDPCTDFLTDPLWYCPDLVNRIINSPVKHEIGCHTFSHIDCRDEVCSPQLFRAEIELCEKLAKSFGIGKMTSFVHPGHTIGNLNELKKLGYTSYRTDNENIIGFPKYHKNGLWEFTTTLELDYNPNWSINSQVNKYISVFEKAVRNHSLVYLWFHPSFESIFLENILPPIFEWLDKHRDDIWIVNNGEYIDFLNSSIQNHENK